MIFRLFFALTMLVSVPLSAATLSRTNDAKFGFNRASPESMRKYQLGSIVIDERVHVATAIYDFAVLGGAQTTHTLKGRDGQPVVIPNKAVVRGCIIDVQTQGAAGGTGTMALNMQSAGDLKTATAAATYTGLVACETAAGTGIKVTADRTLTATIATANWTQGKLAVMVWYTMGAN